MRLITQRNQQENSYSKHDSYSRTRAQGRDYCSTHWLIAVRKTARATDERTCLVSLISRSAVSDRAPLIRLTHAESAALMVAGLNNIVLDFAARTAVGGTDLSFFIIKQLPVLPPEAFLEETYHGGTWAALIMPRVLELIYTAYDLEPFARDLGYDGPPFGWDDEQRHRLKCELDAIFAHMYHLGRSDLEWVLDAPPPSASFPTSEAPRDEAVR